MAFINIPIELNQEFLIISIVNKILVGSRIIPIDGSQGIINLIQGVCLNPGFTKSRIPTGTLSCYIVRSGIVATLQLSIDKKEKFISDERSAESKSGLIIG